MTDHVSTDHVSYAVSSGVATLRMNRADKKNALTQGMYTAMTSALASAGQDEGVRAVAILGVPGVFCAGNDIQDFIAMISRGQGIEGPVLEFLRALIPFEKPLVGGVDGAAVGIGTTMLMHCDYVVASERAMFATPFVDLGIVPEAASSLVGPRIMGHQRAFELLAMGRRWNAERAESAGLINEITTAENLEARTLEVAAEIAAKPAGAMRESRALIRGDVSQTMKRMDQEALLFRKRLESTEAQAAFMAFMTKKK